MISQASTSRSHVECDDESFKLWGSFQLKGSPSLTDGRFVPGNHDLLINVHAVNRDESIWGPDAKEFNPRRFLDASKDQQARGLNSFGIGARSCPGEKLAQSDIFYALVRTLQGAELSCVGGPGTAIVEKMDTVILLDVPRQNLIFRKHAQA